jgi:predicted Kef-type K+ transport protein
MFEAICITFAFVLGLAVRPLGLPPLVGFLAAGFAIHAVGPALGLPSATDRILHHVAHLGVLMLLFTVGLKLKLRQLAQPQVLGGGLLHFALSLAILVPTLHLVGVEGRSALLLAIALSFSSTVLAAKLLEAKRELRAFHGRVAVGILIVQDLLALAALSLFGDHAPSPWALLVVGVPLLRPLLHRLLDLPGHDELLVLMGMLLALVLGGAAFQAVGLGPELGALLMGVLLSDHTRAKELGDSLWSLKEVFLVGFFLEIGMSGLPDGRALLFALALVLVLPLKGALFFLLLTGFRLRARNAFLSALSLTTYSEFGLIVAASLLPEWLVPLALTVALSFVVAGPLNRVAHPLYMRLDRALVRFERAHRHPDEQPADLGDAHILVLGMGRTGTGAYDTLAERGARVVGLDADPYRVRQQVEAGRRALYTDAEDGNFWHAVDLSRIQAVVLAMNDLESKLFAARELRRRGFRGPIVSQALYEDHAKRITAAGADQTYLTFREAGVSLAERAWHALETEAATGTE